MAYEVVHFPYEGTVDADGHVYEPANLWEDYLEAKYKDRAIRVESVTRMGGSTSRSINVRSTFSG
jgi:hypothetical protein